MADERPKRLCDVCGGLDTDPRHVQAMPPNSTETVPDNAFLDALPDGVPARAIAELMDPTTVVRHMDCCAERGCPVCRDTLAAVGNVSGDKLLSALTSGAADNVTDPRSASEV